MKKIFGKFVLGVLMAVLAGGIVMGSFYFEGNFVSVMALPRGNQAIVRINSTDTISMQHDNEEWQKVGNGSTLRIGDIVKTDKVNNSQINFGSDGVMRLGDQTSVQLTFLDEEKAQYTFKILSGRVWLNNLFSNADVNVFFDGGVVFPGQSVSYYRVNSAQSEIYANQGNILLGFVDDQLAMNQLITENESKIINKLFVPQGTSAQVFADKVKNNKRTISKLLYSKLVKEFNYSVFDKVLLRTDAWLSNNVVQDSLLTSNIRDQRLKKIRTRGLKYVSLDAGNYKTDQFIQNLANALTFSSEKVGRRDLDALYDLFYDAQYLFDYGRTSEAEEKLTKFSSEANQLFTVYGDQLKAQFAARVKREYEYLSFVNPADSLYKLKQTLEKIYLSSIAGSSEELTMKFAFLSEKLGIMGFYADNIRFNDLKATFDDYMKSFKSITEQYKQNITANISLIQRQNQALDNLFMQYPQFYRQSFITSKLLVENKYLNLLPAGNDKAEEIQSVIAQRIDFLRKLQMFFLSGDVPIIDAQNIVALLFSEISRIELPAEYQSAVSKLFADRLQDYGVFSRFLSTPEYVNSSIRGATMQERFDEFRRNNVQSVTIEDLRNELSDPNATSPKAPENVADPLLLSPVQPLSEPIKPPVKMPKVKRPNPQI